MAQDVKKEEGGSHSTWPFWIMGLLITCGAAYLIYWSYAQFEHKWQRQNAETRFRQGYQEIVAVTDDQIIVDATSLEDLDPGDGIGIREDCFTGNAEVIMGADRPMAEVIMEYQAALPGQGFEESIPYMEFKGTPEERPWYWFSSSDINVLIYELIPQRAELVKYGIDETEYQTVYRAGLLLNYPTEVECHLMGY